MLEILAVAVVLGPLCFFFSYVSLGVRPSRKARIRNSASRNREAIDTLVAAEYASFRRAVQILRRIEEEAEDEMQQSELVAQVLPRLLAEQYESISYAIQVIGTDRHPRRPHVELSTRR